MKPREMTDDVPDVRAATVVRIIQKHIERSVNGINREVAKKVDPAYEHTNDLWLQVLANMIGKGCFDCCARRGHLSEIVLVAERAWLLRQAEKGTAAPVGDKAH